MTGLPGASVPALRDSRTVPPIPSRPVNGGRKAAYLLRDRWLTEAIAWAVVSRVATAGTATLHFSDAGDGGLLWSVALALAEDIARGQVRITAFCSESDAGTVAQNPEIPKEDLLALAPEVIAEHLELSAGVVRIAAHVRRAISFHASGADLEDARPNILVAQVHRTKLAGIAAEFAAQASGQACLLVAPGPHEPAQISALDEAGYVPRWDFFTQTALEALAHDNTAAASAGEVNAASLPADGTDRRFHWRHAALFEVGGQNAWLPQADARRAEALRLIATANREIAALLSRQLPKYDSGQRARVLIVGDAWGAEVLQALSTVLGGGRSDVLTSIALDAVPPDPELLNCTLPERDRVLISPQDWDRLAGPWYIAGHFALRDHVARAIDWTATVDPASEPPQSVAQHIDRAVRLASVSAAIYAALPATLKPLFTASPGAAGRHVFDPVQAPAQLNALAAVAETAAAAFRSGTAATPPPASQYGVAADDVAVLPTVMRVQLFELLPGTGYFKPLRYPVPVGAPGETADAGDNGDPAQPAGYDAILLTPGFIERARDGIEDRITALSAKLRDGGLMLIPRQPSDGMADIARSSGLRPARWADPERVHAGFKGAIALHRARLETTWSYPSAAEIAEEDTADLLDYCWLYRKGETAPAVELGPPVLKLEKVTLSFTNTSALLDPTRRFRRGKAEKEHRVLKEIDLCVRRGEVVGVVGRNGSGKSTLMRLLVGAYLPDTGTRWVDGETRLVTVGTGLNADLTGYANLMMMGRLIGMTKAEIEAQLDDIVEFTELGPALNRIVRHYSSGMRGRLAFAVATAKQADILILDEVFATGDKFFVEKSKQRIRRLIDGAKAVIIVSHQTGLLSQIATRVVWIEGGKVHMDGRPEDVLPAYLLSG